MDIFAHGLWTGLAFNRSKKFLWAVFFGVAPDIFSFGVYLFIYLLMNRSLPFGSAAGENVFIPRYTDILYGLTHSLVVFAAVFFIVCLWRKKPFLPLLAWGLHIVLDVPLHDSNFFPTPFLFPVSSFKLSLFNWASPNILLINYSLLLIGYLVFFFIKKRKKNSF